MKVNYFFRDLEVSKIFQQIKKFLHNWQQPKEQEILSFYAWAQEHAVVFNPLDAENIDIERLSFLDPLLVDKRVIYLGEEDHWIHEKNEFRLLLLRFLISRGWKFIGEELGWSDGLRINKYLETGDQSYLHRIATYGYRGDLRSDREDKPTGILKDTWENYPEEAFASEQLSIIQTLFKLNQGFPLGSPRLHYFGFDLDSLAGGGYADLAQLLSFLPSIPLLEKLQKLLARVPGETLKAEIDRLNLALTWIIDRQLVLEKKLGDQIYAHLHQWTLTLRDSFAFISLANPATDFRRLNKALAAREEAMFRHVKFILSQMNSDDKLILLGHNRHLSKEYKLIKNPGAAPPGGKLVPSLGTFLNRLLPNQIFSIWMLHNQGRSSQPFKNLPSEYHSQPGSLNAILSKIGEAFVLPTNSADPRAHLLSREMAIVGLYNVLFRTVIAKQADAIFFTRQVSPLR